MSGLKIIIADDNIQFRSGLKFYIENILKHYVVAEAKDGKELLQIAKTTEADILLVDIAMPVLNGIDASREHLFHYSNHKIIAITSYEEQTYLNELIEAGIKGCVFKKDIYEHLKLAIARVMMDELYFPKNISIK